MNNAWQVIKTLFLRLRFIFVFIVIGLVVGNWAWIKNWTDKHIGHRPAVETAVGDVEWFCPMHPSIVRTTPNEKCPICGMPLSKRKKGEVAKLPDGVLSRLQFTPFRIQQAGLATEEIGYRSLVREIRAVGSLEWDERRISHPSVRVAGRVDELFVNFVGARVKKGDPLYRLYSPDLSTTQEEYLLAVKSLDEAKDASGESKARAKRLVESSRERLRLWGLTEEQLAELEKTRKATTHVTISSPVAGVVIKKAIDLGHYVAMGEDPWTLADDSVMWLQVDVFERDLPLVRVGQAVDLASEAWSGKTLQGKIVFIAPTVEAETRTTKVRVEVPNPDGVLKAGMFVTAALRIPLGKAEDVYYGCCDACPEIKKDAPGKCPKCAMELVIKSVTPAPKEKTEKPAADAKERTIYVCEVHPEEVFDQPGACKKPGCDGMALEPRKVPVGSRVVYVCPAHPEVTSDKPGECPKDKKKLAFKIVSDTSRTTETWVCSTHSGHTAPAKQKCPDCGIDMKFVQVEELLAVPLSAVIDTGSRKVVFLERGHGTFDAVEIHVGPRAGEYFPVTKGLAAGDRVVTQGAFLLDAETRLNPAAAAAYFGAEMKK
jgi:RND family efflux transporter MFP subunit